jgi:para-nitrobenzyl esterase
LFHRAILQSGSPGLVTRTREDALAFAEEITTWLGVSRDELAELPSDRIVAAQQYASTKYGLGAFTPYVDGVTLPKPPLDALRDGSADGVPILLGSNRDEWALFDAFVPGSTQLVMTQVKERLGPLADVLHARYLAARSDGNAQKAWVDVIGELGFRIPMIKLAEAQHGHGPLWMYRFDWTTPMLGAAHAVEMPFTWNVVDSAFAQMVLGPPDSLRPLAETMHGAWAKFIRTGEPTVHGPTVHGPTVHGPTVHGIEWPRYELPRRATMLFDRESRVADDPAGDLRALWP